MENETMEYILFSRGVDGNSVNELISALNAVSGRGNSAYLVLNSPGGNVNFGIYCYNMLRALPLSITIHNVGHVDSISNVIFLAGESRLASPSSVFLFHGVTFGAPDRVGIRKAKELVNGIETDHRRIAEIISTHTALAFEVAIEMMETERVYDATWAMKQGIINEIRDFSLPPNHPLHILA